jgi:hypothetical protein
MKIADLYKAPSVIPTKISARPDVVAMVEHGHMAVSAAASLVYTQGINFKGRPKEAIAQNCYRNQSLPRSIGPMAITKFLQT